MHFSTTTVLALLSSPFLALAQSGSRPNAFIVPKEGLSAVGGEPVTLEWNPTTEGTVSLVLRSGSASNLEEGTVIAEGIDNSGSFEWTPSNDLTRGSDYTVQIVDDEDPSNTNYTPYFYLDTDTTVAQVTSTVSLGAPSSAPDASTASPTGDATSLTDVETLATTAAETTVTDSAASTATVQSTGES